MRNDAKHSTYNVGELARLSGVSVRALHHYDAIGLLKPATVGGNGYRLYGREELLRLQQILFHREMGLTLADIASVLAAPDFDRLQALKRHRGQVAAEADRKRELLHTIDRTIVELEGTGTMNDEQLYAGFAPEKQAEHEAYILEHYGDCARERIEAGRRRMTEMSPNEMKRHAEELAGIEKDLGAAVRAGVAPDDALLDPILARHHAWVSLAWAEPPSASAYAGLGELYASHPDFTARYEDIQPGLAVWLLKAMAAFAARRLA